MKVLGNKVFKLDALAFAKGWRKRLDAAEVDELAGSIRSNGLINLPLVRAKDKLVICGADRCAAVKLLKQSTVEVRVCEATDAEVERLRITENLHRHAHTPGELDDMRREYVTTRAAEIEKEKTEGSRGDISAPGCPKLGRPASAAGAAKRELAAASGVSEDAIKHSVARAEAKAAPKPEPTKPTGPQMTDAALALQGYLVSARTALGRAMASVTDALKSVPAAYADHADLALLHRQLKHASTALKMATPERLCPYCKAQKPHMKDCPACKGLSYLTPAQGGDVPKELLVSGDGAGIFVADKFVRLADL